jgi:hypothetical protein
LLEGVPYEQFVDALQHLLGRLGPQALAYQCIPITYTIRDLAETIFNCPCLITVGSVTVDGRKAYQFSTADIRTWTSSAGTGSRTFTLHVWLTLPTDEIIDATLSATYAAETGISSSEGGLILDFPESFNKDLVFHPCVVGDDIVNAIIGTAQGAVLLVPR